MAGVCSRVWIRSVSYTHLDVYKRQNLHITELSGREEKDIRSNYDALIDYNSLFNHQPLKFPTCAMSESGRIHFEEVKKILDVYKRQVERS